MRKGIAILSLALTILCSTSVALILKQNEQKSGDILLLLSANYFMAAIIGLFFLVSRPQITFAAIPVIFGAILAGLFVFSFFAFAAAVAAAGTALATVSARLSVVIPVVLSILIFSEKPGLKISLGLLLTLLTLVFFYVSLRNTAHSRLHTKDYFYIIAVLVGIGLNDFSMKLFSEWRPLSEKPLFLLSIFFFAFVYSFVILVRQRIPYNKATLIRGAALGVPNIFSSFFLLGALQAVPAMLVYPIVNISVILLTALAAALLWKERLNSAGVAALISGSAAIVLLV